eukprot:4733308-Prymnesium_polylepis.1
MYRIYGVRRSPRAPAPDERRSPSASPRGEASERELLMKRDSPSRDAGTLLYNIKEQHPSSRLSDRLASYRAGQAHRRQGYTYSRVLRGGASQRRRREPLHPKPAAGWRNV